MIAAFRAAATGEYALLMVGLAAAGAAAVGQGVIVGVIGVPAVPAGTSRFRIYLYRILYVWLEMRSRILRFLRKKPCKGF